VVSEIVRATETNPSISDHEVAPYDRDVRNAAVENESITARASHPIILGSSTSHRLEDEVFSLCSEAGVLTVTRTLRSEMRAIRKAILDNRSVDGLVGSRVSGRLLRDPEGRFANAMHNALPVFVGLLDAEAPEAVQSLVKGVSRIYSAVPSIRNSQSLDPLDLHKQILYTAFAIGALAVSRNEGNLARSLLSWASSFDAYWQDRSWIRYVATMLARRNEVKKSIINPVKEYWSHDDYMIDSLGGNEETWNYLCQFDFLQCANILATGSEINDCFASFSVFQRHRVQPIVEKMIDTHTDGVWLPPDVPDGARPRGEVR
jgi:hypothetical protein